MSHRQITKISRLMDEALKSMSDEELHEIIGDGDYSQFTDAELPAIQHGTADQGLIKRFEED